MLVRLSFFLYLAAHFGLEAAVTVENNAYHGLVISFAPEVDPKEGKEIIDSLKNLLESTSDALRTAIGVRIADVTFHLPSLWDTSSWENVTVNPASTRVVGKEDILVENVADSAFGGLPFALQYSGCAVSGHKIAIPTSFLNGDEVYPKSKLLAREWLKYRYGVFDENGFLGDEMYPSYYQIPGTIDVKITECTDPPVEYNFKNSSGDACSLEIPFATGDCQAHPNENSLNVTSSLMYFHQDLKAVEQVCGKNHTHKGFTPSKHNTLCNGKSIWEVLEMSPDFKNGSTAPDQDHEEQRIEFSYLQETKPRVVLAFENSIRLHKQGDKLTFAIRRLIYDLPDGSDFGLYSYDNDVTHMLPLSELTSDKRKVTIPLMFVEEAEDVCLTCAFTEAVQALEDKPEIQGNVILIADSTSFDADKNLVNKLEELKLKERNLCLNLIAFTDHPQQEQPAVFDKLKPLSDCIFFSVLNKEETATSSTFLKLHQDMLHAIPLSPAVFQTTKVAFDVITFNNSLDFPTDPTSGMYTLWFPRLLKANFIQCKAGDQNIIVIPGVQIENLASYSFHADEDEVTCKLSSTAIPATFALVEMTTKPGEFFKEEVWVHDMTSEVEGKQMPVIIFARINYGNYPVQNAKVVAEITGPNEEGSMKELELFDNGKGDPDITQNDGIYSRYFVDFTGVGEYKVIVTVEDKNSTSFGKTGANGCCGSKVMSESVELHPFKRSIATSFQVRGNKPEGGYKPSRILDLRMGVYDPMNSITLKWTAPGGEADNGKATSYEFHFFCKSEDCKGNGELPPWIKFNNSIPTPSMSGQEELVEFLLSDAPHNDTLSIGLLSINQNQKHSSMSNLVMVELDTSFEPPTTKDPEEIVNRKGGGRIAIRAIVGGSVFGLFLLMVVASSVYCLANKIRRYKAGNFKDIPKSEHINCEFPEQVRSSNLDSRNGSMRRVESFPVLLYTHDQIKDFKNKKGKEAPLYKEGERPKPWMSLESLPSKSNKDKDGGSDGSASTMPANDSDSHLTEMKELEDNKSTSNLHLEKVARF